MDNLVYSLFMGGWEFLLHLPEKICAKLKISSAAVQPYCFERLFISLATVKQGRIERLAIAGIR